VGEGERPYPVTKCREPRADFSPLRNVYFRDLLVATVSGLFHHDLPASTELSGAGVGKIRLGSVEASRSTASASPGFLPSVSGRAPWRLAAAIAQRRLDQPARV
jgi:hypothetical protein